MLIVQNDKMWGKQQRILGPWGSKVSTTINAISRLLSLSQHNQASCLSDFSPHTSRGRKTVALGQKKTI